MNLYIYSFFIIYSLYDRFSKDKHFDIFVVGLFSVFFWFFATGIIGIGIYFFCNGVLLEAKDSVCVGIPLLILNFIIFSEKKQLALYGTFKKNRSNKKDIMSILIFLLSILFFCYCS